MGECSPYLGEEKPDIYLVLGEGGGWVEVDGGEGRGVEADGVELCFLFLFGFADVQEAEEACGEPDEEEGGGGKL